jgi:hypothetical protein
LEASGPWLIPVRSAEKISLLGFTISLRNLPTGESNNRRDGGEKQGCNGRFKCRFFLVSAAI